MLWGRPTWGVYWVWDARLTTTALLAVLLAGYLALRRVPADPISRSRRAASRGLLIVVDLPIIHCRSTGGAPCTRTRPSTIPDAKIDGLMLFTLFLGMVVGRLVTAWLLSTASGWPGWRRRSRRVASTRALAERRAEAEGRLSVSYAVAGYVITVGGLGGYAAWILVRGRRLSTRVPAERRRWIVSTVDEGDAGPDLDLAPRTHAGRGSDAACPLRWSWSSSSPPSGSSLSRRWATPRCSSSTPTRPSSTGEDLGDRPLPLQGTVVEGSVDETDDGVSFQVEFNGVTAGVVHQGDPPELFQPGIPVVLEGHWEGEVFASDRILVKHTSEYEAENEDRLAGGRPEGRATPSSRDLDR